MLLSQITKWEMDAMDLLGRYRTSNPKGWNQFSERVHSYAKSNATAIAPEVVTVNEVDLSGSGIRFIEAVQSEISSDC